MSIERPVPLDQIDFSVDPKVIDRAYSLLGKAPDAPKPGSPSRWLKNPARGMFERLAMGLVGSTVTFPIPLVAMGGVKIFDGNPTLYNYQVGFLDIDNQPVNLQTITKVRSLKQQPWQSNIPNNSLPTALTGGKMYVEKEDRVHSWWGTFIRKSSIDETPQLWSILKGTMVGVGARGYTIDELDWLARIFQLYDRGVQTFPQEVPDSYRKVVSEIQPRLGLFSLSSATKRKRLTISERLITDWNFWMYANPLGDLKIILATVGVVLKGIGAK